MPVLAPEIDNRIVEDRYLVLGKLLFAHAGLPITSRYELPQWQERAAARASSLRERNENNGLGIVIISQ
jgi:hypothetical protein